MTGSEEYIKARQLYEKLSETMEQSKDTALLALFGVMKMISTAPGPPALLHAAKEVLAPLQKSRFFKGLLEGPDRAATMEALYAFYTFFAQMELQKFLEEIVPSMVCQPKRIPIWENKYSHNTLEAVQKILAAWETGCHYFQNEITLYYAHYKTLDASDPLMTEDEFCDTFEMVCTFSMLESKISNMEAPKKACAKLAEAGVAVERHIDSIKKWALTGNYQFRDLVPPEESMDHTQLNMVQKASKALAECSKIDLLIYLTMRADENDVPLENGVAYQRFCNELRGKRVVVINPSASFVKHFLLQWSDELKLWRHVTFAVTTDIAFALLKQEFRFLESKYSLAAQDLQLSRLEYWKRDAQNVGVEADGVLFFAQDVEKTEQVSILQILRQQAVQPISLLMLTASADFQGNEATISSELYQTNVRLNELLLLPKGIPYTTYPKRKLLLSATFGVPAEEKTRLERYRLTKKGNKLFLLHETYFQPVMIPASLQQCEKTLRREFRKNTLNKTENKRDLPNSFDYCPELSFWYSKTGTGKQQYCITAYPPAPSEQKLRRGYLDRGKPIPETKRFKKISADALDKWLEYEYVNTVLHPRKKSKLENEEDTQQPLSVKDAIRKWFENKEPVSLKLYALLSEQLEEKLSEQQYKTFSSLLHTRMGFQNVETSSTDSFCLIAEDVLENGTKDPALQIISQVLDLAVEEGYSKHNVLRTLVEHTSFKVRDGFAEVRNALVKKAFTMDEMRRMYTKLMEEYKEQPSCVIGTLIRLFTGLEYASVCALRWKDYVSVRGYNFSEFMVMAKLSSDGMKRLPFKFVYQFRRIPCVPVVEEKLKERFGQLQENHPDWGKKELDDLPILWSDEEKTILPKALNAFEKQLLKKLRIPSESLVVPGDDQNDRVLETADFGGDLLRNSFRVQTSDINTAALTTSEQCYLLGLQQQMTLGRNYLDFLCDGMQYLLFLKLMRLQMHMLGGEASLPENQSIVCDQWKETELQSNQAMRVELDLHMHKDAELSVELANRFGARVLVETRKERSR